MFDLIYEAITHWGLIFGAVALPFLLSAAALTFTQYRQHRRPRGALLPSPAGEWVAAQVARHTPHVEVQLHSQEGLDAYFPGVDAIGLSQRTWNGRYIEQWTIAAHELGHAINIGRSPELGWVLPGTRLASDAAWRGFAAAFLVGAFFGSTWVLGIAWMFALGAVLSGAIMLADEASASLKAMEILRGDRAVPAGELGRAMANMRDAFALYAAIWVGQVLVLIGWPILQSAASHGTGVQPTTDWSIPALWLFFVLMPFFLLRAAHVISQIWRPEPVGSEFRMFTVMQREAQWEFFTGFFVLMVVAGLYDHASGPVFVLSVTLAAMTAIGPLAAVGRALVLFPILLTLRRYTHRKQADDEALFPETRPEGAAPALMALYNNPPWYLRLSWVTNLAFLPLVIVLVAQLAF
mgnify:CR=1 FL=1